MQALPNQFAQVNQLNEQLDRNGRVDSTKPFVALLPSRPGELRIFIGICEPELVNLSEGYHILMRLNGDVILEKTTYLGAFWENIRWKYLEDIHFFQNGLDTPLDIAGIMQFLQNTRAPVGQNPANFDFPPERSRTALNLITGISKIGATGEVPSGGKLHKRYKKSKQHRKKSRARSRNMKKK